MLPPEDDHSQPVHHRLLDGVAHFPVYAFMLIPLQQTWMQTKHPLYGMTMATGLASVIEFLRSMLSGCSLAVEDMIRVLCGATLGCLFGNASKKWNIANHKGSFNLTLVPNDLTLA